MSDATLNALPLDDGENFNDILASARPAPARMPVFDPTYQHVPADLKPLPLWMAFQLTWDAAAKNGKGGFRKKPFNPVTGVFENDAKNGVTFDVAFANYTRIPNSVLGLYIESGLIGIDFDNCIDENGLSAKALEVIEALDRPYAEVSPSGTGIRILIKGKKPGDSCRCGSLEIYSTKRGVTITGARIEGTAAAIVERDVTALYGRMMAGEFTDPNAPHSSRQSSGGAHVYVPETDGSGHISTKTQVLLTGTVEGGDADYHPTYVSDGHWTYSYPGASEATHALLCCLAIKHKCDRAAMEEDYLSSNISQIPHWRDSKWNRLRERELDNAIKFVKRVNPKLAEAEVASPAPTNAPTDSEPEPKEWPYAMTQEEYEAECEAEYPVFRLRETAGPVFDDADLYGVVGQVTRKLCKNSEAYPPTVYLNLIVSLGCAFDRAAYFNVDGTKHFTIDFLACVGDSSTGRKGTSADAANSFLHACGSSLARNLGGFGSPQGVIEQIKDSSEFRSRDKKTNSYKIITVPGVLDKRLCIRENELSSLFKLIADPKTKAAELFRDLWDSKPAQNHVAGRFEDGSSRSLRCEKPHVAIIGSSTPSLVKATLPVGADKSGDGNRFIWCHTKRTQLCPHGGPQIDWASETVEYAGETIPLLTHMQSIFQHARHDITGAFRERLISMTKSAWKYWTHLYERLENDQRATFLGFMTARAAAHIRRLAMILALVDLEDAVDVKHLKAAEAIWNYSQESARFIFKGYSLDQEKILRFAETKGAEGITVSRDLHTLFGRNRSAEWLRAQVAALADGGFLTRTKDKYLFKKY